MDVWFHPAQHLSISDASFQKGKKKPCFQTCKTAYSSSGQPPIFLLLGIWGEAKARRQLCITTGTEKKGTKSHCLLRPEKKSINSMALYFLFWQRHSLYTSSLWSHLRQSSNHFRTIWFEFYIQLYSIKYYINTFMSLTSVLNTSTIKPQDCFIHISQLYHHLFGLILLHFIFVKGERS